MFFCVFVSSTRQERAKKHTARDAFRLRGHFKAAQPLILTVVAALCDRDYSNSCPPPEVVLGWGHESSDILQPLYRDHTKKFERAANLIWPRRAQSLTHLLGRILTDCTVFGSAVLLVSRRQRHLGGNTDSSSWCASCAVPPSPEVVLPLPFSLLSCSDLPDWSRPFDSTRKAWHLSLAFFFASLVFPYSP